MDLEIGAVVEDSADATVVENAAVEDIADATVVENAVVAEPVGEIEEPPLKSLAEILDEIPESSRYGVELDSVYNLIAGVENVADLETIEIDDIDAHIASLEQLMETKIINPTTLTRCLGRIPRKPVSTFI